MIVMIVLFGLFVLMSICAGAYAMLSDGDKS